MELRLNGIWPQAGLRQASNLSATSFEPDSVMEFGLYCVFKIVLITFRLSRRRREMYCGHPRLCVCVSVRGRMPTLLHGPGCNLAEW